LIPACAALAAVAYVYARADAEAGRRPLPAAEARRPVERDRHPVLDRAEVEARALRRGSAAEAAERRAAAAA